MTKSFALYSAAALMLAALPGSAFAGQVQWNEVEMATGPNAAARFFPSTYRTDTVDVPVRANDGDTEYMIRMKAGDTVVYSWEVVAKPGEDLFYSEFHGHTVPTPTAAGGSTGTLMFYRKATGTSSNGTLTAPFEGIHGWYLQNQSDKPVTVRLRLSGFYEVIPDQAHP